jgi:nitrogen fixation NifU-like protein
MKFGDAVIKHFQSPQNVGEIKNVDGFGRVENPICGDITDIYLRIKDGRIEDAKFKTLGCAVTISSGSVLTEAVKGKRLDDLLEGKGEQITEKLIKLIENELGDIPGKKLHCPPASVEAFLRASLMYYEKHRAREKADKLKALIESIEKFYQRGVD